jgi:uncharacterized damage-inducible protein DinB
VEIRSVAQFLEYWESFRGRTRRVIVVAHFGRLAAESRAVFAALPDTALERKCQTPAGTPITTWKWLRAMVEHEAHHRGQLYLMLGMLDVATPRLYGLTSEEVRAGGARAS